MLFADGAEVSEPAKKSGSFAASNLNSGIMVRLSISILPDNVTSKTFVPIPATFLSSSKYSPLSVNPKIVVGSKLR